LSSRSNPSESWPQIGIERRQALLEDLREGVRIEPLGEVRAPELQEEMAQRREAVRSEVEDQRVELLPVVPARVEDPPLLADLLPELVLEERGPLR
jgi:hypothetical protein